MVDVEYRYSKNVSGSAHYRLYVTTDTTRADKIFFQIQFDAPIYRDAQQDLTTEILFKVARWQNLIPSFPWIATGWRVWGTASYDSVVLANLTVNAKK